MKASKEIQKPTNWQDFETLCLHLWKDIWNSESLRKNGRNGQYQAGIDIYGCKSEEVDYSGIQCKKTENLSSKVIDREISNAKKFEPPLKRLVIATTMQKDAKIEQHVRLRDQTNKSNGLFSIVLYCWEDIEEEIRSRHSVNNWYNNGDFRHKKPSTKFSFDNGDTRLIVKPKFLKTGKAIVPIKEKAKWEKKQSFDKFLKLHNTPSFGQQFFNSRPNKLNESLVTVSIKLKNIGNVSLSHIKVKIKFEHSRVIITNTNKISPFHPAFPYVSPAILGFNIDKKAKSISYCPSSSFKLVKQDDLSIPEFYIQANPKEYSMTLTCELYSEELTTFEQLELSVEPELRPFYTISTSENLSKAVIKNEKIEIYDLKLAP